MYFIHNRPTWSLGTITEQLVIYVFRTKRTTILTAKVFFSLGSAHLGNITLFQKRKSFPYMDGTGASQNVKFMHEGIFFMQLVARFQMAFLRVVKKKHLL
jgi:hypothetical protein